MARTVELQIGGQQLVLDLDRVTGFRIANDFTERPGDDGWVVRELTGTASLTLMLDSPDAVGWRRS